MVCPCSVVFSPDASVVSGAVVLMPWPILPLAHLIAVPCSPTGSTSLPCPTPCLNEHCRTVHAIIYRWRCEWKTFITMQSPMFLLANIIAIKSLQTSAASLTLLTWLLRKKCPTTTTRANPPTVVEERRMLTPPLLLCLTQAWPLFLGEHGGHGGRAKCCSAMSKARGNVVRADADKTQLHSTGISEPKCLKSGRRRPQYRFQSHKFCCVVLCCVVSGYVVVCCVCVVFRYVVLC